MTIFRKWPTFALCLSFFLHFNEAIGGKDKTEPCCRELLIGMKNKGNLLLESNTEKNTDALFVVR